MEDLLYTNKFIFENKKRKIAAFLAVAELNDVEKKSIKKQKTIAKEEKEDENDNPVADIAEPHELVTKYSTNTFNAVSDKPQLARHCRHTFHCIMFGPVAPPDSATYSFELHV